MQVHFRSEGSISLLQDSNRGILRKSVEGEVFKKTGVALYFRLRAAEGNYYKDPGDLIRLPFYFSSGPALPPGRKRKPFSSGYQASERATGSGHTTRQ